MRATSWSPLLLLLLAAAGPKQPFLGQSFAQLGAQTSVTAPAAQSPAYQPAPVPDRDITAPPAPVASNDPSVSPSFFTQRQQFRGDGYAPNSTAQISEDRNMSIAPGLKVSVPLSQW
jgi:hypothetical protein